MKANATLEVNATLAIILGIIAGVLEYLNQQTFGFSIGLHNALKYGLLVLTSFAVTPLVGQQLGLAIANLLHLSHAALVFLGTLAVILAAFVTTFSIDGVLKGVILGVAAFLTAIFGPRFPVAGEAV